MLKLLRKDWILNRRPLLLTYAFWSALWLGFPALRPTGDTSFNSWAFMVSLACGFLPIIMVGREDKFKAGALGCSLPVSRDAVVVSRYLGGWLTALAAAALAIGVMAVLSAAGLTELALPAPGLLLGAVVTIGLVMALLLPFTLRFGIAGLLGFLIAAQLLGIVALLGAAMFGAGGGLRAVIRGVVGAVAWAGEALGPGAYEAAVLAAIVVLNLVSCRVAIWIYRRREF